MADPAPPGVSAPAAFGARGDGRVDDTVALQAAFDAGGAVHLPGGAVFRITGPLVLHRPIAVTGSGELRFTDGIAEAPAIEVRGAGSSLRGLRLTNPNRLGRRSGPKSFGVLIRADGVTVADCAVDSFQSGIVVAADGEWVDTVIRGNRVTGVLGAGAGPRDARSAAGEDRGDGICVWGARATVTGNLVACAPGRDARVGIHAEALTAFAGARRPAHQNALVTISGNVVHGRFRRGITVEGTTGAAVTGNSVADSTWQAVLVTQGAHGTTVTGNTITWTRPSTDRSGAAWNPTRSALMVYGATRGAVFADNTVRVVDGGALDAFLTAFAVRSGEAPADCVFRGNSGFVERGRVGAGVRLDGACEGIVVTGNLLSGLARWGVYGFGAERTALRDNDLSGVLTAPAGVGVRLEARTRPVVVAGNRLRWFARAIEAESVEGDRVQADRLE